MSSDGNMRAPKHWKRLPLGEVVDILDSRRVPVNAKEREGRQGTVPYYGATGQVGWIDEYLFDEELVLLGEDGAPFFDSAKQKAYVVRGPSWVNNHAHVLRTRDGMPSAFLKHQLDQVDYRPFVSGTTRAKLPQGPMRQIGLVVPPADEQRAIVAAIESHFSRLDAATASLERVQRNLERYRASVLKAAVEGRLVPTEAELARKEGRSYEPASELLKRILAERRRRWEEAELAKLTAKGKAPANEKWKERYEEPAAPDTEGLPELPEGWCWATVEELVTDAPRSIQSGPFGSNLLHSEFQPTGRLVIGIDNVRRGSFSMGSDNRISDAKFRDLEKYLARAGDVLVTVMATVGRCCVVPDDIEPAIVTKHVYRMSIDQRLAISRFIMHVMLGAPSVRAQMQRDTRGQTRPGINGEILRRLVIPVPPRSEQARIVAQVDRLLSMVDQSSSEADWNCVQISRLRQSILKWAFEGRLTVGALPAEAGALR